MFMLSVNKHFFVSAVKNLVKIKRGIDWKWEERIRQSWIDRFEVQKKKKKLRNLILKLHVVSSKQIANGNLEKVFGFPYLISNCCKFG